MPEFIACKANQVGHLFYFLRPVFNRRINIRCLELFIALSRKSFPLTALSDARFKSVLVQIAYTCTELKKKVRLSS